MKKSRSANTAVEKQFSVIIGGLHLFSQRILSRSLCLIGAGGCERVFSASCAAPGWAGAISFLITITWFSLPLVTLSIIHIVHSSFVTESVIYRFHFHWRMKTLFGHTAGFWWSSSVMSDLTPLSSTFRIIQIKNEDNMVIALGCCYFGCFGCSFFVTFVFAFLLTYECFLKHFEIVFFWLFIFFFCCFNWPFLFGNFLVLPVLFFMLNFFLRRCTHIFVHSRD